MSLMCTLLAQPLMDLNILNAKIAPKVINLLKIALNFFKDIDTLINVDIFLDHPTTTTTNTATTTTPGIVCSKNYWDILILPCRKFL